MNIDDIIDHVESLGGVLTLRPQAGDGSPEISWGDSFFYYAPDGQIPSGQPFATIVTKDYSDDRSSRLDRPDTFRVNIAMGATEFRAVTGHDPQAPAGDDVDPSAPDVLFPHPVYGALAWMSVVNPAGRTSSRVRELLASAHGAARTRRERRARATNA